MEEILPFTMISIHPSDELLRLNDAESKEKGYKTGTRYILTLEEIEDFFYTNFVQVIND